MGSVAFILLVQGQGLAYVARVCRVRVYRVRVCKVRARGVSPLREAEAS